MLNPLCGSYTLTNSSSDDVNSLKVAETSGQVLTNLHLDLCAGLLKLYGRLSKYCIVGYLMPNPLYTYISNLYDL